MHASNVMNTLKKIKYTLELTEDVNAFLDDEAEQSCTTKSEVLRKCIALLKAASLGKQKGWQLAFVDPNSEKVVGHIVGL